MLHYLALCCMPVPEIAREKRYDTIFQLTSLMHQDWYYKLFGEEFGPVPFDGLCDLAQDSHISEEDEVRNGPDGNWQQAGRIVGLFETSEPAEIADLSELEIQFESSLNSSLPQKTHSENTPAPQQSQPNNGTFYCQVLGQELGPMSLDDLLGMVRDGSLSADDVVKNDITESWQPAVTIPSIAAILSTLDPVVMPPDQLPTPETPSKVLAEIPDPPSQKQDLPEKDFVEEQTELSANQTVASQPQKTSAEKMAVEMENFFEKCEEQAVHASIKMQSLKSKSIPQKAVAPKKLAVEKKEEKQEQKPKAAPKPSKPQPPPAPKPSKPKKSFSMPSISLPSVSLPAFSSGSGSPSPVVFGLAGGGVLLLLILLYLIVPFSFGGSCEAHVIELNSVLAEFRQLRQQGAGEAQWSALRKKIETDLKPVLDELAKTANTNSDDGRARRHLLFVLRDHLPKMLVDAREAPSQSEMSCQSALVAASELTGVKPPTMISSETKVISDDVEALR